MAMTYAHPHITTFDSSLLPAPPEGWRYFNLIDPESLEQDSAHYPVLLFGSYTYTALSDINNDYAILVVAWDMQRNLVKQWNMSGARYIWQISFEADTENVIFIGQASQSVTATLDELTIAPAVVHLPTTAGPALPCTLSYGTPSEAFPVIKSGPHRFWPASYADDTNAFCVVVADRDNVILELINCPGSSKIEKIEVNETERTIQLVGEDGASANLDYNTALACFSCCIIYTKDNFLFLAQYFNLTLSDDDAIALAQAMPQIDCSECCRMEGTGSTNESERSAREKRSTGWFILGSFLGAVAGGIGGFCIGGPPGALWGASAGYAAGGAIGASIPSSSDTGDYQLSDLEVENSLVGYAEFPCGPFANTGAWENVFDSPFPRYAELPYSAAVTKLGSASFPQAYSPATKAIGDFPRDPRYNALRLADGVEVAKYIFVIIKTDKTVDGNPGYQMRINPEDFYPTGWNANQRVNHSQLSEGYRFWALVGNPHMQVYAAGSLYVDLTNKKLLGIDTRTGHYFKSFRGHDQAVNDATFGFLASLGYNTAAMKNYIDMFGYLQW